MHLRGVIFDLDGVIADTAEYHYRAWQRMADEEGLPFDRAVNEHLRGVSRRASLEIILAGRPVSEERLAEMMERKNGYYVEMLTGISPADLLPGVEPLLRELRAAGVKIGLGSASKSARTVIDRLGIGPLFDAIADSASVDRPKPAPDLFLAAARQLGLAPAACAVVEDAAAGVDAALAAGMWAIGLGPEQRVGHAHVRFSDLEGVTLAKILAGLDRASWTVAESSFDPATQHHMETVFTTGNGHFCTRGTFEEGYPDDQPASFMYGLWDDMPINFTELANLPRWWGIDIWLDGVRFQLDRNLIHGPERGRVLDYRRDLDLRQGLLSRRVRWQPTPGGPEAELRFERFASLDRPDLAVVQVSVTMLHGEADLRLRAGLDMHVENTGLVHWDLIDQSVAEDLAVLQVQTRSTRHKLAVAAAISTSGSAACQAATLDADGQPAVERRAPLRQGDTLTLHKFVALVAQTDLPERRAVGAEKDGMAQEPRSSDPEGDAAAQVGSQVTAGIEDNRLAGRQVATPGPGAQVGAANAGLEAAARSYTEQPPARNGVLARLAEQRARAAQAEGYAELARANAAAWSEAWHTADVVVEGDHEAQLALRFNIFQLLIAAPRWSDHASIGAKTLSGFGYRHHVFWDTEIFMLPLFVFAAPALARNMLMYRYHNLPGARAKAAANGFEGAQFPWESAGDGREVTPPWVPHFADPTRLVRIWTGDIEIHITADIAYAAFNYAKITGDEGWLADYGAQLILDGAKFWASAAKLEDDGRYHYRNVIGPDEYHDRIDDNAYTNLIARWHLQTALDLVDWLKREYPVRHDDLAAALDLSPARLSLWRDVIKNIFLPRVTPEGVIEQFTGYFDLPDADIAALRDPQRKLSMQAILGIEGCAQTQILKQPDVLMYMCLFPEQFSAEQVRANYDYYSPRTDHELGSSLGPSISAIMACRVGDAAAAYEHFMRAARADLRDVRANAGDGIHGASAGGLWQAATLGFAGLSVHEDLSQTQPRLPEHWERLAFRFYHRGKLEEVEVRSQA